MAGSMRAGIRLEVDRTGNIRAFDMLRGDVRELNAEARRTNEQLRNMNRTATQGAASFDSLRRAGAEMRSQLLALAGVSAGIGLGGDLIKMADDYARLQAKIKLATTSTEEMLAAQAGLETIAKTSYIGLSDVSNLYANIAPTMREAGNGQKEILTTIDSVSKSLALGGATATGSAAAILQLTQALGSGVLRGEEFNSIMENGRGIAVQLAQGMDVPIGALRSMAQEGKLTADVVTAALIKQNTVINDLFSQTHTSVENAMTNVKTEFFIALGEMNKTLGVTAAISKNLLALADNMGVVFTGAALLAALLAGKGAGALAAYTAGKIAAANAARALAATEAHAAIQQQAAAIATARAAESVAAAQLIRTQASLAVANAERAAAASALLAARGTDGYAAALVRSIAAHEGATAANVAHTASQRGLAAATAATTVAQNAGVAAATRLAVASRALSGALMLVGGPVGALVLGAAAMVIYREELMGLVTHSGKAERATELHALAMDNAKEAAYQYATATKRTREELDRQKDSALAAAKASVEEAKAALESARTKLGVANTMAAGGDSALLSGFGSTDSEEREVSHAEKMIEAQTAALKALEERYKLFGKTKEELDAVFTPIVEDTTKAVTANTAATGAATKANVEAGKALHSHGDALKSLIEGLAKQRIELEHGKLAAQYYTDRLNGLTDAEARAAAGANQYNDFLAERKRLTREAAEAAGGLKSAYLAKLDEMGLGSDALSSIDAVKSQTDSIVAASNSYQQSIDAATESLKAQAEAVKAVGTQTASVASISKAAAGTAAEVVGKLQALGWSRNQAIGIAANLKQESEFRPDAVGDGGNAYGVAQWHPDRQANFSNAMGKNIRGSSLDDQLKFLTYEMTKGAEKGAGNRLKGAESAAEAAAIVSKYYERPLAQAKEMHHRAGIANGLAKSLGDSIPTFAKMAVESAKVAPAMTAATAGAQKLADVTVEYGGAIDSARVSEEQRQQLVSDYMSGQANALIKSATDHAREIKLTGAALREWELIHQEFAPHEAARILAAEQLANYAEELSGIEAEAFATKSGMAAQYSKELEKQNLSQEQIAELVSKKMAAGAEKLTHEAGQQTLELQHTAAEWKKIKLAQDGYNAAQLESIANAERLTEETQRLHDITNAVGDGLLSVLTAGIDQASIELDGLNLKVTSGMKNAMESVKDDMQKAFSDLVIRPTLQPLTDGVSRGIQGMMQGQANPWAGLQQAYGQSMASMQAGGAQGAMTSAGLAAGVVGMLGGTQGQVIGSSMGSAAGNALAVAFGASGPIGAAIGGLLGAAIGGLLEKKPKAEFVGSQQGEWELKDTRKLYASSALGEFGFTDSGTRKLGGETEQQLERVVAAMAQVDNALAKFIPTENLERVKADLAGFRATGTDFSNLFKDRLLIITRGFSDVFNGLIDYGQDAEGVLNQINNLLAIQEQAIPALRDMGLQIGVTADAALSAAAGLSDAAGGLQGLTSLAAAYYDLAYSEEERQQRALDNANAAIDAFNAQYGAQIDSVGSLRQYIDALDMTQAANQQAAVAAMGLAGSLSTVAASAAAASAALGSVSLLDSANAKLEQQRTVFGLFNDNLSNITSGLDSQLRALESSYRDQIRIFEQAQSAANSLRGAIRGLITGDLTALVPVKQLEAARSEFERLKRAAGAGDVDAAKALETAGETLLRLSREYNASNEDYSNDFARVQGGWESVADLLEDQRDPQRDMLDAQQRLIDQAANQAAQMAAVYGGIIGGNSLLTLLGKDIDNLPPDIAVALKSVLDGLKPENPKQTVLSKAEFRAKGLGEADKVDSVIAKISTLYPLIVGRGVDSEGLKFWSDQVFKHGMPVDAMLNSIIDIMLSSAEFKALHPNSHATGLYAVPYDNYSANLHAGEAVIDAASMAAMRKYGIPLQSKSAGNSIIVNVDMDALVKKVESLTAEVRALRSERSQDAQSAQMQRDAHIRQTQNTDRGVIRAVKMRGGA